MTRNQISLIEAREKERANRAAEEIQKRGQNMQLAGNIYTGTARAAGSIIPKMI